MSKSGSRDDSMDMADWDARLRSPDCSADDRKAFESWYAESAANRKDFDGLTDLLGTIREMRDEPELRSLQEWAVDPNDIRAPKRRALAARSAVFAATVAAVAVGLTVFVQSGSERPVDDVAPTYSTAVGERSTVYFVDGTVADLNTDTELRLQFTKEHRSIELIKGQALFNVAEDESRPFVVIAGDQRIVAVGTVFDVRVNGSEVAVTLIEGRVDVAPEAEAGSIEPPTPIRMRVGERLTTSSASGSVAPVVEQTDAKRATIWREGRVFFDKTKLADAIAEMNRYSLVKIELDQESLADIPVSGMFRTGRQSNFVETLESYFPLKSEEIDENLIVLREK